MKIFILILTLFSFPFQIFGQQKSMHFDTLSISVNESIRVEISSYENGWLMHHNEIFSRIENFKNDLEKIQDQLPLNCNLKLTSKTKGEIIVEKKADIINYQITKEIVFTRQHKICINSDNYNITIYFNELDDILTSDIQECVNKVINLEGKHLKDGGWVDYDKGKYHGIAWTMYYKCYNDTAVMVPEKSHYNANKSMLEISPGIGVGILQNEFVSDFSFRIGRYGTNKGIIKRHQYISYSWVYNLNQDNNFNINQFINLGYRVNLSNNLIQYKWLGFEIGYLINKKGNFFKSPTIKLGTMIDLKHNIHLTPEIYFEDGFKKVYPGLRIGIDIGL